MTNKEMAERLKDAGERILSNVGFSVTGESAVAFGALLVNAANALARVERVMPAEWIPPLHDRKAADMGDINSPPK